MTQPHPSALLEPFDPALTIAGPDEAEVLRELDETMATIREKTFEDGGHAIRSVHAKSHGLLRAELEVLPDLPPVLAQGIFATPRRYPVIMRFSTIPGDILPDSVSTPRGFAMKVMGVEGPRLPGHSEMRSQDFVMVNGPTFTAPDAKAFLKNLKLLAPTTDRAEGLKTALSAALRGLESVVEAVGGESATLKALGGHPATNILGETYYSQLPIRYGAYIAKISIVPVSFDLKELTDAPIDLGDGPDVIRDTVRDFFRKGGAEWELRVQLCINLKDMPIEPADVEWSEEKSPYITVARLRAAPQDSWNGETSLDLDDSLGFSPWHGVEDHWPLGPLMRVRQMTYENSQTFRSSRNRCTVTEPQPAQEG